MQLVEVDADIAGNLGVRGMAGIYVPQLFMGSPADRGGMMPGDIVTKLNGMVVAKPDHLVALMEEANPHKDVTFDIVRRTQKQILSFRIGATEEEIEEISQIEYLWPGFVAAPLTQRMKDKLGLGQSRYGVLVSEVIDDTQAHTSGFRANDVIFRVNDIQVKNMIEFFTVLGQENTEKFELRVRMHNPGQKSHPFRF